MAAPSHALEIVSNDYPARMARAGNLVLIDFLDLVPEVHGDPHSLLVGQIEEALRYGSVAIFARLRNSRPPPSESRSDLTHEHHQALGEFYDSSQPQAKPVTF